MGENENDMQTIFLRNIALSDLSIGYSFNNFASTKSVAFGKHMQIKVGQAIHHFDKHKKLVIDITVANYVHQRMKMRCPSAAPRLREILSTQHRSLIKGCREIACDNEFCTHLCLT